ncbi:unnamed protein product [Chilo suppressalis]|uniref:Major facilitator superfamily (MFS) profile domain-containing protein n=1 Tax=Chilo suppressalis TaxID=168631 RepID=A0ABN8L8G9_CHISP|nr:hypothetical protein evm_006059 [Chilo suppressalis]CAH2991986.1 unnamed protein product [Chilo suppressalis]
MKTADSDNPYSDVKELTELQPLNEKPALSNNDEDDSVELQTFSEKFQYALKNVTIEPTMILFVISAIITMTTSQNLSLEKACRVNLNFSDEICSSLRMQKMESQNVYERDTQKLLAAAMSWRTYITATIPCFMAIFIGSFSDKTGHRRVFVLIPIAGQVLVNINNIANTYFFYQLPLEVLILSEAIIEGFSGGWCVCFTTIFSYICAITTQKTRTFRLGLVNFCMTVGFPVGMGLSGILIKKFGFYGCYAISGSLQLINLLYNIFAVKDPKRSSEHKEHDRKGAGHFFRTFFDLSNIKETVIVVFKKGPNRRRLRMIVLLLVVTILFGPMFGEISILYMSTRYRFNWDELQFSMFQTYNFVIHTIGTIFSIAVLSKYLQWHDSMLGIISTISKIAASFVYCFAPNERIFYIAPAIEILNGTSLLALRSITSKLVAPNELGKVNSIFSLTENLMPLVYVPLYTKVYSATMEVLPGAVFLLGAAMTLPAVVVFLCLFVEHRKGLKKKPEKIENGL